MHIWNVVFVVSDFPWNISITKWAIWPLQETYTVYKSNFYIYYQNCIYQQIMQIIVTLK